jgi:YHS domain-containing protein
MGQANALVKPYPLNYCLVSGDKIGEMGEPAMTNYMGQEIKFCCADCVKDFNKNPKKYLKKLAKAEAKMQKEMK